MGRPNAGGTAGGTHNFQASNILAQRYATGVAGRIVALLAYFHGTGTPSFRMSLYRNAAGGLPGDLLAVLEGQAPGVQGWHELALSPAHYLDVIETTVLWIGAQTSANTTAAPPAATLPTPGAACAPSPSATAPPTPSGPAAPTTTPRPAPEDLDQAVGACPALRARPPYVGKRVRRRLRAAVAMVSKLSRARLQGVHAGFGWSSAPAASAALERALERGPLTIVSLGPLTNVAATLQRRPDLADNIGLLVSVMGRRPGHVFHPAEGRTSSGILFGHGSVFRDLNFSKDPTSASIILGLVERIGLTPYAAAREVMVTRRDLDRMKSGSRAAAWLVERAEPWLDHWERVIGLPGFYPFDALAALYVLHPQQFRCAKAHASIARDDRLPLPWRLAFGSTGFLVGLEADRPQITRASGSVTYCGGVEDDIKDVLLDLLTRQGANCSVRYGSAHGRELGLPPPRHHPLDPHAIQTQPRTADGALDAVQIFESLVKDGHLRKSA